MTPNKGQWDERIKYNVDLSQGKLYIEEKGMTFYLTDVLSHKHGEQKHDHENNGFRYHVINQKFINSNWGNKVIENQQSDNYKNYFLGIDSTKWKVNIKDFSEVKIVNFYDGIDLIYRGENGQLSYNFEVQPHAKSEQISFEINGADRYFLDNEGKLHITHRFGEIIQSAPIAWTIDSSGKKVSVLSNFIINNRLISFEFPNGYDKTAKLVIDPNLTFSTFTGSSADNWGFTATPDEQGNLFGGGIIFGSGYPLSVGAYDVSFGGGTGVFPFDVGITKYNAKGSQIIYSTYLGGSGNETPHSIVCAPNGELYIYGATSSTNFPMAGASYDKTFNGGPNITENNLNFEGSDIYVARISPGGNSLLSSTFVGGSNTDGLNTNSLHYNYGDQFRGEITLDENMNVFISSTTESANFPTANASQNSLNGTQDAIIFRMNKTLSSLDWSTFFGGSGNESGNSVTIGSNGLIYAAGGTTSSSLPLNNGQDLTFNGGSSDGYVLCLNANSGGFQSGTYMGMNEYDQTYFVQTDVDNSVYVYGQTESDWPITPGCYGKANSGQFVRKYSTDLSTIKWTTMIGGAHGHVEISPTAFLVSDCYDIYLAGWGGILNQDDQAKYSTSYGFQCTPDGYQITTNGNNFYIAVLDQDASALKYGTFMGGTASSYNHVDGGTSRFDKSGRIYHAVCGACGGNQYGFTSTPGSWSPTNNSTNCNMATFKFELSTIDAIVAQPDPLICLPKPVQFQNTSTNGNAYFWDFGDGTTSTDFTPSHIYINPGVYDVKLIVSDTNGCFSSDSVFVKVTIGSFNGGVVIPAKSICKGASYQLEAFGGSKYSWSPANVLNNPTLPNPIATINSTTTFTVTISDSCGTDSKQVTLIVEPNNLTVSPDTSICLGQSVILSANTNGVIQWQPSTFLNNPISNNPTSSPTSTITYIAISTSANGCTNKDSVTISVSNDQPKPNLIDTLSICRGGSRTLYITGGISYNWSPNSFISNTTGSQVTIAPPIDQWYYCEVANACGTILDSVFIKVQGASIIAGNDTIICPNEKARLWADGASYYDWFPKSSIVSGFNNYIDVKPNQSTNYLVVGTDSIGCKDSANVQVNLYPNPSLFVTPDVMAFYGEQIQLNAATHVPGYITWTPSEYLSCVNCPNPVANPNKNMSYTVYFEDIHGCKSSDIVKINYDAAVYVPNTFIPDEDKINDVFRVYGGNILEMECLIFNRWGELIYTLKSLDECWDGTYKGEICQDGTYTWKLVFKDFSLTKHQLTGHVNLIR